MPLVVCTSYGSNFIILSSNTFTSSQPSGILMLVEITD